MITSIAQGLPVSKVGFPAVVNNQVTVRGGQLGWLQYGDVNDSILYRSSLLSPADVTSPDVGSASAISILTLTGSGGSFDPVKGYKPGDAGSNSGAIKIDQLSGYPSLQNAGQMSFEVETQAIPSVDGTNITGRIAPGTGVEGYFWSVSVVDNAILTNYMRFNVAGIAQRFLRQPNNASGTTTSLSDMSVVAMPPDYVTVRHSWSGTQFVTSINDEVVGVTTYQNLADLWKFIYIGSRKEALTASNGLPHYIRNLQISDRPAVFYKVANVSVSFVGDSLTNFSAPADRTVPSYSVGDYQNRGMDIFQGLFNLRGMLVDMFEQGVPGDKISEVSARRSAILADNPTHLTLLIGTNNALAIGPLSDTDFDIAVRAELAAYSAGGIANLYVCTIPSLLGKPGSSAEDLIRMTYNVKINAMTDVATIIDIEAAIPRGQNLYEDEVGGNGELHFAAGGNIRLGTAWYQTISLDI